MTPVANVTNLRHTISAWDRNSDLGLNSSLFTQALLHKIKGAQWLSGRVFDSRPKGRGFEPHRRHGVVVLEQDTFILA